MPSQILHCFAYSKNTATKQNYLICFLLHQLFLFILLLHSFQKILWKKIEFIQLRCNLFLWYENKREILWIFCELNNIICRYCEKLKFIDKCVCIFIACHKYRMCIGLISNLIVSDLCALCSVIWTKRFCFTMQCVLSSSAILFLYV